MAHTARITYPGTRADRAAQARAGRPRQPRRRLLRGLPRAGRHGRDRRDARGTHAELPRPAARDLRPADDPPARRHAVRRRRRRGGHVPLGGRAAVRELPLRRLLLRGGARDVRRRRPAHADQRVLAVRHLQRHAADPGPDRGDRRPDHRPDHAVHRRALLRHRPGGAGLGGEPREPAALHGRHRVLRHQDRRA